MTEFIGIYNTIVGVSIVVVYILLFLGLLLFFISKERLNHSVFRLINNHSLKIAWLVSLVAVVGSLIYSEVIGFSACNLCWIQRMFIYPQFFILGLAVYKKDEKIVDYSLLLSIVGIVFALYHKWVEISGDSLIPCSALVACDKIYVNIFGYITIPVMSITTFLVLGVLMLIRKYSKN